MAHLEIQELAALVVGEEDRLLIHLEQSEPIENVHALVEALAEIGLKDRCLLIVGTDIQAYKIEGKVATPVEQT